MAPSRSASQARLAISPHGEQLVGGRCPRPVGPGTDDDTDGTAGQERAHGGGGLDDLVGVVLALEPPGRAPRAGVARGGQDPQVAALGIMHAVGDPGCLVATFDDVGLAVAVEVGQRRGRKVAVRREPGEPGQGGPGGRVDGVLFLAERWRHRVEGAALEVAESQRGPHGRGVAGLRVAGRVLHGDEPALGAVGVEGLVTAGVRGGRVADPDEHGVIGRPGVAGGAGG